MIIKLKDKVTKLEQFLSNRGCLIQFMENLNENQGVSIKELVRDSDYDTIISGAFVWAECPVFAREAWKEINNQWKTTIEVSHETV